MRKVSTPKPAWEKERPPHNLLQFRSACLSTKLTKTIAKLESLADTFLYFTPILSTRADEMFADKYNRPALRVGAEGQTLPLPEMRIVNDKKMKKVEFVKATEDADDCPPADGLPEVALIGRSNVGKSSLLNLLTQGSSGALVSSKPGTTQRINHYLVVGLNFAPRVLARYLQKKNIWLMTRSLVLFS